MTQNIMSVDYNGVKVLLDSNTKLIFLYSPNVADPETCHDMATGNNYQVPVGKKATVIYLTKISMDVTDTAVYADDVDGTTNAVTIFTAATPAMAIATNMIYISIEIPAGKYINRVSGAGAHDFDVVIIEEDA